MFPNSSRSAILPTQPYIVMECIPGKTLYARLPELPLPYAEVAEIGVKIAQALDDLHRQHVVHLDIKPSNIMFRPTGEAVLLDFGLSHHDQLPDLMQEEFRLPFGTAPYMSPEQLLGIRNDPRSDLFALGVLLYFFSTGVRPFGESETLRGMRRRLWRDPVPPRRLRPDYPPWLQEIVLRCLEIEPAWRYPTAAQLAFDLSHPNEVKLTTRSERMRRDPLTTVLRRRFNKELTRPRRQAGAGRPAFVRADHRRRHRSGRRIHSDSTTRCASPPGAFWRRCRRRGSPASTCSSKAGSPSTSRSTSRATTSRSTAWSRLQALGRAAEARRTPPHRARARGGRSGRRHSRIRAEPTAIDHILIGARQNSLMRKLLGSVSAKVAAEAPCTVTVVRPHPTAAEEKRPGGRPGPHRPVGRPD